jgi:glycosyltransferase involved in cell wall biosynthesis
VNVPLEFVIVDPTVTPLLVTAEEVAKVMAPVCAEPYVWAMEVTPVEDVLRNLMLSCHVMLGQFEEHQRLERTIQHKTFEALALGMPYITRESKSNRELLTDGTNCLFVPPKNPEAICEAILRLEKNPDLSKRIASGAYELYQQRCSQEVLVNELEILLQSLS